VLPIQILLSPPLIVQHPQRPFTPTRCIPTHRTPATTVAFLLTTAGTSLPFFLLPNLAFLPLKPIRIRQNTLVLPIQILLCVLPIFRHPKRCLNLTRRISTSQTPATTVSFPLITAAISLPLFLLLTLRTAVSFHVGLLALFHPWLATNHLHLMARVRHLILKRCFVFFDRSSVSVLDAWVMPFVLSPPASTLASCAHGPTAAGVLAASRRASTGPKLGKSQPWSHCALRQRPAAYRARWATVKRVRTGVRDVAIKDIAGLIRCVVIAHDFVIMKGCV